MKSLSFGTGLPGSECPSRLGWIILHICTDHILFTRSPVGGHLGGSYSVAAVDRAAVNMGEQISS